MFGFLENCQLGGPRNAAPPWRALGLFPPSTPRRPQKPPKTNEKSMIRALEPPRTSPERSGTAQDHLKASISHPSAAQDRAVRPPRRHVVCLGSRSVCPGSNSMCPGSNFVCPGSIFESLGSTKIIEILLEIMFFLRQASMQFECDPSGLQDA